MWFVIIVAIIAFCITICRSFCKGEFEKNDHFNNLMFFLCDLFVTGAAAMACLLIVLIGSCVYVSENEAVVPYKLVDTENYYLAEIVDGTYVSISSNEYYYATQEDEIIHFQQTTASKAHQVKISEDVYEEGEAPMVFIDHYVCGGTFFIDNFTFCGKISNKTQTTFYIPEDTVGTFVVEIK